MPKCASRRTGETNPGLGACHDQHRPNPHRHIRFGTGRTLLGRPAGHRQSDRPSSCAGPEWRSALELHARAPQARSIAANTEGIPVFPGIVKTHFLAGSRNIASCNERGRSFGFEVGKATGRRKGADWIDPFLGLRAVAALSDRWDLSLPGDVGGFGIGADMTWQAVALVRYRLSLFGSDATAAPGYRLLDQDYESSGFDWNVTLQGAVLGLGIRFRGPARPTAAGKGIS